MAKRKIESGIFEYKYPPGTKVWVIHQNKIQSVVISEVKVTFRTNMTIMFYHFEPSIGTRIESELFASKDELIKNLK